MARGVTAKDIVAQSSRFEQCCESALVEVASILGPTAVSRINPGHGSRPHFVAVLTAARSR